MSYCINCGVKLEDAAKRCILCGTVVVNPNNLDKDFSEIPPAYLDSRRVIGASDRKFSAMLINLILFSLNITVFFINIIFIKKVIFWPIVVSSTIIFSLILTVPLFFRKLNIYVYLTSIAAGIMLLFISISWVIDSYMWVKYIAFPILITIYILVNIWFFIKKRFQKGIIFTTAITTLLIGVLCIFIEGIIKYYFFNNIFNLTWSVIVLICALTINAILLFISQNNDLRNELRKRFHF